MKFAFGGAMIAALLFWGVLIGRLAARLEPPVQKNAVVASQESPQVWIWERQQIPSGTLRDPFRSPLHTGAKSPSAKASQPRVQEPVRAALPPVRVDAILPGEKPVAILRNGQNSAVLAIGQEAWGMTLLAVSEKAIRIRFEGREHEIAR